MDTVFLFFRWWKVFLMFTTSSRVLSILSPIGEDLGNLIYTSGINLNVFEHHNNDRVYLFKIFLKWMLWRIQLKSEQVFSVCFEKLIEFRPRRATWRLESLYDIERYAEFAAADDNPYQYYPTGQYKS